MVRCSHPGQQQWGRAAHARTLASNVHNRPLCACQMQCIKLVDTSCICCSTQGILLPHGPSMLAVVLPHLSAQWGKSATWQWVAALLLMSAQPRPGNIMQGMQPDVALLQGLALVEQLGEEQVVVHYPARGLSQDPATRFAQLFATRPRHAHIRSQRPASSLLYAGPACCLASNGSVGEQSSRPPQVSLGARQNAPPWYWDTALGCLHSDMDLASMHAGSAQQKQPSTCVC